MAGPRFASKVDWWLGVILIILPVAMAGSTIVALLEGEILVAPLPLLFVAAIYGGLLFPLYYELTETGLLIRYGQIRQRVPYAEIREVRPSSNPLSSPALSLDRLHVAHGRWGTMISPRDKLGFLDALSQRTPHLRRVGDSLLPD